MNRSNNLLNGSLLGPLNGTSSGGSSGITQVFVNIFQRCEAQTTSLIHAGKYLKNTVVANSITTGFKLSAGRKLKALAQVRTAISVRLDGWAAVMLEASTLASTTLTAQLSAMKAVKLAAAIELASYNTFRLQKRHPVLLESMSYPIGAVVTGEISRARRLSFGCVPTVSVSGVITEASRVRAPIERTAYVPESNRVSVIQGI